MSYNMYRIGVLKLTHSVIAEYQSKIENTFAVTYKLTIDIK